VTRIRARRETLFRAPASGMASGTIGVIAWRGPNGSMVPMRAKGSLTVAYRIRAGSLRTHPRAPAWTREMATSPVIAIPASYGMAARIPAQLTRATRIPARALPKRSLEPVCSREAATSPVIAIPASSGMTTSMPAQWRSTRATRIPARALPKRSPEPVWTRETATSPVIAMKASYGGR